MDFAFLFNHFFELTITGLAVGSIYALVALGYTMVYGVLQLINFAHSEVFMFGTFATVWTLHLLGVETGDGTGSLIGSFLIAIVVAMGVSGLVALLLERVAYRPLIKRNAPKLIALISAIGASFVLSESMGLRDRIVEKVDWLTGKVGIDTDVRGDLGYYVQGARDITPTPADVNPHGVFTIGDYRVTNIDILLFAAALLMMLLLDQFIRRSRLGRGIRAVAQDPEAAALMGVNATRVIQTTFLIGGMMAGAAATLYMVKFGVTKFNVGFILGIKAFTAAVMGGIGNLRGALLGGLLLGVLENWGSGLFGSQWIDVFAFVLLVLILLFRPTGLLGESLGRARA